MSQMKQVKGVLSEIMERPNAWKGKTAYDIVVGGEKYGNGFFAPKAKVGDYVEFTAEDRKGNGYWDVAPKTLKVSDHKPSAAEQAAAAAPARRPSGGNSFDNRQDVISRQAAANTAINFVELLKDLEALPFAASTKKQDREGLVYELVKKYTAEFYEFNTGTEFVDISPNSTEAAGDSEDEEEFIREDSEWQ